MTHIGIGIGIGFGGGVPSVFSITGSDAVVAGYIADNAVPGATFTWPDEKGNAFPLTQSTGSDQPSKTTTGGPNSTPSLLFDGSNDFLVNTALDRPAPGTQPTVMRAVLRQVTWVSTRNIWSFGAFPVQSMILYQSPGTPTVTAFNGADGASSGALTVNTYKRIRVRYSNQASDYLIVGANAGTNGNATNTDPTASFFVGKWSNGAFSNVELCQLWIFNRDLTASEDAALDALWVAKYGASITA